MHTIWKFPLELTDTQEISIPSQYELLDIIEQHPNKFMMWAVVNEQAPKEIIKIEIYGTGHPIKDIISLKHIKTLCASNGILVWHFFERISHD